MFVISPHPYSWLARAWRWFSRIGRDSTIYPTPERIHFFAFWNVVGLVGVLVYYALVGAPTNLFVAEAIALVFAVALWILIRRHPKGHFPYLGFYAVVIWVSFVMSNTWCYIGDGYSRFRLLTLLITTSTYYLVAEWWHVLLGTLLATVCTCVLFLLLQWPPSYPPQGDMVTLMTTHIAWLGFSLSGRSKRESRLRDTQSLVRYIQRGLQPGLQSLEAIMPELRYTLAEALQPEDKASGGAAAAAAEPAYAMELGAATRIHSVSKRLHNNIIAMEDYLDIQCVNARFNALEGRLQLLHAAALLHELIQNYPYTSDKFKAAVQIRIDSDFAFVGVREQWTYALRNLLDNAMKALFCLGLRPRLGDVQIFIDTFNGLGRIRLIDQGIGIAQQHLPDVFEPFYAQGKLAGLGLGLAYCKAVVDGAGGSITVQSEKQQGCQVQVCLPKIAGGAA